MTTSSSDEAGHGAVNGEIRRAISRGGLIDITTVGRRSGQPQRIEIAFHNFGGRIYISGIPRAQRRSWLANLDANPRFTFHLKGGLRADLPATARIIEDEAERRVVLSQIARVWKRDDVDTMLRQSPLIEVMIDGLET
jgi:deazaflavin-dependent oxidoreductase (nitroreductase family)